MAAEPVRRQEKSEEGERPSVRPRTGPGRSPAVETLLSVSHTIAGTLDRDGAISASIRAAADAMRAEACSILLRESGSEELSFHIVEGDAAARLSRLHVPIDTNSIAGWVACRGEPLLIPDAYEDPRFNPSYDRQTGFRTKSVICVPLCAKGEQLGVIQILNRRDGRSFDADDLELADAVASLIAVAIHNANEHEARMQAERVATIGQAIAGLAHCIKNILNGLQGGSYIVDTGIGKGDSDKAKRGWGMVKRNMSLLSNIVLDMLSYSKNRRPSLWACEANEICEDVVALLEGQALESGVKLETDLSADVREVEIDAAAVKRCLINLVGNAVDACGQTGGSVTVQTRLLERPGFFAIRVCDTGCGIDPGALRKIFDPFYSTKGNRGTGLGLAVTKKIVEEHQGVLRVDSTPGKGTVFAMELPVRQSPEPHTARTKDPEEKKEERVMPKVLVVDDEPDAREFVTAIMEAEGWEVAQAEDGKAGLAAARSDVPDLIVLDVQMPKMDGFDVFAELIKDPKLKDVKVVMLTGVGEKVGIRFSKRSMGEYLGKEPAGYAEKPIDPEIFKKLVRKVTSSD